MLDNAWGGLDRLFRGGKDCSSSVLGTRSSDVEKQQIGTGGRGVFAYREAACRNTDAMCKSPADSSNFSGLPCSTGTDCAE